MDIITVILVTPFVLVVEGAVLGYAWTHPRGSQSTEQANRVLGALYGSRWGLAVLVGAWLLMTAVAFVYEFFVTLIVLYGLLFVGGRVAGWLALILLGVMFVSTPGICGWLLVRVGRNHRSPGGPRRPALVGIERRGEALPSA